MRYRAETGHCDQRTGALQKVSDAPSALGVAVGDGRRRRCAKCVYVERQRLQRLQQTVAVRIAASHLCANTTAKFAMGDR
eukprot:scaffold38198_cov56-Phaeocystis_antarctica.AAC.1